MNKSQFNKLQLLAYNLIIEKKLKNHDHLMIWGSRDQMIIGAESRDCLIINNPSKTNNSWQLIDKFIEKNQGQYIFGYIGFDLHAEHEPMLSKANYPSVILFVPKQVFIISNSSINKINGRNVVIKHNKELIGKKSSLPNKLLTHIGDNCSNSDEEHLVRIKKTIDWINDKKHRRATVARKIQVKKDFDLLEAIKLEQSVQKINRLYHLKMKEVEILGNSPELLAYGKKTNFKTYKLSGTAPKNHSKVSTFTNILKDPKLINEHLGSIYLQRASLLQIGNVMASEPKILDLKNLLHIFTEFKTIPKRGTSIGQCIRAIFPSGVFPYKEGIQWLSRVEKEGRGAYYGLVGVINPMGGFEFSQVIRTLIKDKAGIHSWVGGAITNDSQPEIELQETYWKLKNFPIIG